MSWMNCVHDVYIPCAWRPTERRRHEGFSKSSAASPLANPWRGSRRHRRCFQLNIVIIFFTTAIFLSFLLGPPLLIILCVQSVLLQLPLFVVVIIITIISGFVSCLT